MDPAPSQGFMTIQAAAHRLGVSHTTARRIISEEGARVLSLPGSNQKRVSADDIEAILARNTSRGMPTA